MDTAPIIRCTTDGYGETWSLSHTSEPPPPGRQLCPRSLTSVRVPVRGPSVWPFCDDGCTRRRWRRHRQCPPPEGATPPCLPQVCTDERRNGPCRVSVSTTAHSARRFQGPEERYELNYTATIRSNLPPPSPSRSSSSCSRKRRFPATLSG